LQLRAITADNEWGGLKPRNDFFNLFARCCATTAEMHRAHAISGETFMALKPVTSGDHNRIRAAII
jgi:hypothetical protein